MTVQEQREVMLTTLARIDQRLQDFEVMAMERSDRTEKDCNKIIARLDRMNGSIALNSKKISDNSGSISKIIGIGIGISFILGIAITVIASLI